MKKPLTFFSLFISLSFFSQQKTVDELITAGNAYYENENFNQSAKSYEDALLIEPKNSKLLNSAGTAYFRMKNFNKAREKFRLAALYCPASDQSSLSLYYSNLSASYTYLDNDAKAYEYAMKAYRINDSTELNVWNAASNSQNFGKCDEAIAIMDKAKIKKHYVYYSLYSRCYVKKGEYEKGVQNFLKFFENYDPKNKPVNFDIHDERTLFLDNLVMYFGTQISEGKTIKYKDEALQFISALSETEDREEIFKYFFRNRYKEDWFQSEAFNALRREIFGVLKSPTLTEEILNNNFFNNYSKVVEQTTKRLKENLTAEEYKEIHYLKYIASLHLYFEHAHANKKIDDAKLQNIVQLFKGIYPAGKIYSDQELDKELPLIQALQDTLQIVKQYCKTNNDLPIFKDTLKAIFKDFPNLRAREELLMLVEAKQFEK